MSCSICFEETQADFALPCKHRFHNSCITHWLLKEKSCPLCRTCMYVINSDDEGEEEDEHMLDYHLFFSKSEKLNNDIEKLIKEFAEMEIEKFRDNFNGGDEDSKEWNYDKQTQTSFLTLCYNKKHRGNHYNKIDRFEFTIEFINIFNSIGYFTLNINLYEVFYRKNTNNRSNKHEFKNKKRKIKKRLR